MEDRRLFRQVMGRLPTGVTVVTTRAGDLLHGLTVSAFMSVSLEPLQVLISVARKSRSHALIQQSGIYAVNMLSAKQAYLADLFAGRFGEDACRFARLAYRTEVTGAPLLDGAIGQLDCRVAASYPGGDHTLFLGSVEWMGASEGEPLVYHCGGYCELAETEVAAIAA